MFSMMTGWPSVTRMRSAITRAPVSSGPPAGNGTTSVIGRVGKGCVAAGAADVVTSSAAAIAVTICLRCVLARIGRHLPVVSREGDGPTGGVKGGRVARRSIAFDIRCLDDREPLVDLGLVVRGECFGCLLLARWNLVAMLGHPLAHRGIGECCHYGTVEPCDNIFRRAFGHPESMPEGNMDRRSTRFLDGRNVGRGEPACLGGDGHRPDLSRARERDGVRCIVAHEIDLAPDEVLHGWGAAAIGYERELRTGRVLQIDTAKVRAAAATDRCRRSLGR